MSDPQELSLSVCPWLLMVANKYNSTKNQTPAITIL